MAITDEEYASAIEQHMQAHKAYLEKQKEEAKMGISPTTSLANLGNMLGSSQSQNSLMNTTGSQNIAVGAGAGLSNSTYTTGSVQSIP